MTTETTTTTDTTGPTTGPTTEPDPIAVVASAEPTTNDRIASFVATFASADASDAEIVASYRAIPNGARGGAVTTATMAAIANGIASEPLAARLGTLASIPVGPAARVRPTMSDSDRAIATYIALARAYDEFVATLGIEVDDPEFENIATRVIDAHADAVLAMRDRFASAMRNVRTGDRTRTTSDVGMADLVASGTIPVGATLTGRYNKTDFSAVVMADGTVASGDVTGTVSTVATTVTGQKAVNGWRFWHYGEPTIATIRSNYVPPSDDGDDASDDASDGDADTGDADTGGSDD